MYDIYIYMYIYIHLHILDVHDGLGDHAHPNHRICKVWSRSKHLNLAWGSRAHCMIDPYLKINQMRYESSLELHSSLSY